MRLIDADAFRREIDNHWPFTKEEHVSGIADMAKNTLICVLNTTPTIEERKRGKWICRYICSECYAVACKDDFGKDCLSDYCSCCGAYMRGEEDETD